MALVNEHFLKLPGNYLFADIAKKVNAYKIAHPKQRVISLGIGDVTQPLSGRYPGHAQSGGRDGSAGFLPRLRS